MPAEQPRLPLLGMAMFVLILSELLWLYSEIEGAKLVSIISVFAIFVLGSRFLKIREAYLIGVCLILAFIAHWGHRDAIDWMVAGLSSSAYLAAFILLMALLREGALTSTSVVKLGRYLTMQPSNRRFVAVFSGAHALAVMINLGALSLLAPIIQRGVRANLSEGEALSDIDKIRERRQLTATLRGFSWFLVWAPTAVTQAVMPTLMSGIDALRLIGLGLLLALTMLFVSWVEDWLRWRRTAVRLRAEGRVTDPVVQKLPTSAARSFSLICAMLFACSIAFSTLGEVTIVTGVMLTAPLVVLVWVVVQQRNDNRFRGTLMRFENITFCGLPAYVRETIFVACAGFIGTVGAKLVPVTEIANAIGLEFAPGWLVLWGLTSIVLFCGQIGLSPITMAIFLGSIVAQINPFPVDMTHAALAIAAGTAVCTTGAPFSSGALMLARATDYSSVVLTWKWNGVYTIITMIMLAVIYMGLEGL